MFFADLAVVRPEYKDVCDKVFRWLSTTRQDKGNGIYYWSILEGGGPSGPWAHGPAAPVMFFLALNEKFGNAEALDYAKGVTNWVVSAATPERGGYTWDDFIGTKRVNLDYNHGVAGTMAYLAEMYRITGDEKYKEYALGATRWMEKMAVPVDDGYKWLRMYNLENRKSFGEYWTGRCAGAAGTAMGLYRVYMATDDPTAKRLADGSLRWLMDIAEKTEHGYRWPRREGFKEYGNSYGKGAAGVGDAFLYGHV
ncbi:MAG: hypothetical protein GWP08_13940, partial [Nitrospiraceae bacterium]|nr:hypothetical protein [Nitrospiraceae bacterium]